MFFRHPLAYVCWGFLEFWEHLIIQSLEETTLWDKSWENLTTFKGKWFTAWIKGVLVDDLQWTLSPFKHVWHTNVTVYSAKMVYAATFAIGSLAEVRKILWKRYHTQFCSKDKICEGRTVNYVNHRRHNFGQQNWSDFSLSAPLMAPRERGRKKWKYFIW